MGCGAEDGGGWELMQLDRPARQTSKTTGWYRAARLRPKQLWQSTIRWGQPLVSHKQRFATHLSCSARLDGDSNSHWHNVLMQSGPRPTLEQVTLCAVDTRAPALALDALKRSLGQARFGRVVLFTSPEGVHLASQSGIEAVEIELLRSGSDYSRWVVQNLPPHIQTSHVLISQWDGFVTHAGAWSDDFLSWDYIGAVWPDHPTGRNVGNGGFSLRSQSFLRAALQLQLQNFHPEDQVLCRDHRVVLETQHGIRFAPPAVARRFAYENEKPRQPTFGFHGPYNLPNAVNERELMLLLDQLPDDFFRSRDARRLARALLLRRMPFAANALLQRRSVAGKSGLHTRLLGATAALMTLLIPHHP
jgi:hypothetical protein